jgi:hypothetical protein
MGTTNLNPLGYTGRVLGSTKNAGVVQFDPTDFTVDEYGVVHLGGTGAVQTINNLPPTAGNITIAGTANQVGVANAGSTVTLSLPAAITAPGSLTTSTTLTSGTDITSTLGHVIINGAAKQLRVHGGAVTDFIGQATLVAGTVTIANTNIAATDRIIVERLGANGSTAVGVFNTSISAGASFTITSLNPTNGTTQTNDVSTVNYFIVRQV